MQPVIILDVIEPGQRPGYCIHGPATCIGGCGNWLWLGNETTKRVQAGAAPMCAPCAERCRTPDTVKTDEVHDTLCDADD